MAPRKLPKGVNPVEAMKIAQWVQSHEIPAKQILGLPPGIEVEQIMSWFVFYGWKEDSKAKLGYSRVKKKK